MATHRCRKNETTVVAGSVAFLMKKRKEGEKVQARMKILRSGCRQALSRVGSETGL